LDNPILIGLDHPDAGCPDLVGNKFAGLARLKTAGYRVPAAYAIPAATVSCLLANRPESGEVLDAVIRQAGSILPLPEGIAVRSSGLLEDNRQESGAGRFRTILDVRDKEGLRRAIGHVLEGYLTEGIPPGGAGSVILQEMVRPDAAGVAFSRHPVQASEDWVVVEAVQGLADRLVSGEVPGYRAILAPDLDPPPIRGENGKCVLASRDLVRLRTMARSVEALMDGPVDIEWAISGNEIFLLQARPALALSDSRPRGTWTRAVAEDLWGEELCAVDASILMRLASSFDLKGHARQLGIPIGEDVPTMAVIEGHLFVNGDLLAGVLSSLPRAIGKPFAEKLLPPGKIPERYTGSWKLLARLIVLTLSDPGANPLLCPWVTRRKIRTILAPVKNRIEVNARDLRESAQDLESLLGLHASLLEANQVPYLLSFLFAALAGDGVGGTVSRNNPTVDLYRRMEELAAELRRRGVSASPDAPLPPDLSVRFDEFIAVHGSKSDVRSLAVPRWREEPGKVLSTILAMGAARRIGPGGRSGSARTVRWTFYGKMAGWYLDLREELRDALDRILDAERQVLLRIDALLGWKGTIFDRSLEEILGAARGESGGGERRPPVRRKIGTGEPKAVFPPRYFVDGRAVDRDSGSDVLRGIPVSSGRTKGKSRRVGSLEEAMHSPGGEILIAWTMGPSWAPVLSKAIGVVLAEGGMLSHFSIIAREQNIPCVVGAGERVLDIPDGTEIMVDGYEGVIRVVN
jgi:phosphohistidine swiveling domain-containing protein